MFEAYQDNLVRNNPGNIAQSETKQSNIQIDAIWIESS